MRTPLVSGFANPLKPSLLNIPGVPNHRHSGTAAILGDTTGYASAALPGYRRQGRLGRHLRDPAPSALPVYEEAGYPPEPPGDGRGDPTVVPPCVYAGELFAWPVLAPADGGPAVVRRSGVGPAFLHEPLLVRPVDLLPFRGREPSPDRPGTLVVDAPAPSLFQRELKS